MEGKIPHNLNGVLCRNGPGRIRLPSCSSGEDNDNHHNDANTNNQNNDDDNDSSYHRYGHWFDGDGYVTKLTFHGADGRATYTGKYVRTDRYVAQQQAAMNARSPSYEKDNRNGFAKAGAWTSKGTGKWWQNLFQFPTNPANTNVIFTRHRSNNNNNNNTEGSETDHNIRLYAIAEGGDPVPLDIDTLETIGPAKPWTTKGVISQRKARSFFSAHASQDFRTGVIYNHGVRFGVRSFLNLMKFTPEGNLIHQRSHEIPFLTFLHDNVISEHYMVLVLQPFGAPSSALVDLILGKQPLGNQLEWNTSKFGQDSIVLIYDKDTLELVAQVPIGPVSTYHLLDAFEADDDTTLTLRMLSHETPDVRNELEDCFKDLYSTTKPVPACELREISMDVSTQSVIRNHRIAPDASPCELPDTNTRWPSYRKRYAYLNVRGEHDAFLNRIQKVNLETGEASEAVSFGPHAYAGAPLFAGRPNARTEDDGYVLAQVYRAHDHQTDVVILDARSMKLLTRLRLSKHVPYQFHGAWCSF